MADESIDRLSLEIIVNDEANSKLEKILSNVDSLVSKLERLNQINNININLGDYEKSVSSAISKTEKLVDTTNKITQNVGAKIDTSGLDVDTSPIGARSSVDVDNLIASFDKLQDVNIRLAETKQKIAELAQGGATVQDNPQLRSLILQAQKLQAELDKANNSTNGARSSVDKLGKTSNIASKMLNKLSFSGGKLGKLFNTIKRIAFYRFIRSGIRAITQFVSTGIQDLYQYSNALNSMDGGKFASNLDRLSTSLLYLKNSLGAIISPIVNALTPAVESLIDRFAELNNKIASFFAALTGQNTYTAAIKYNKAYADSALKVAKANQAALASFDEINNITISNGSGSGSALDYTKMFEEVETPISALAEKIKAGDWRGVGESLADKLNEQVDKLSSSNIGKKISEKLHNALDLANGFLRKFNFKKFATTILTELFAVLTDETTWAKLGELISNLLIGALDVFQAAYDFITDPNTYKKIGDAFIALFSGTDEGGGIDWYKITYKLTTAIFDLIYRLGEFVGNIGNWDDFGSKFFTGMWSGIKQALAGMWDAVKNWFDTHSLWSVIERWIRSAALIAGGLPAQFGISLLEKIFGISTANTSKTSTEKQRGSAFNSAKNFKGYATGGFQEYGEIYKARENGIPELVGTIGNRAAVANNDQIVQAVSIGVYNAVVDAMTKTSSNQKKQSIVINGREIFSVVQDESQSYKRRTGQPAF